MKNYLGCNNCGTNSAPTQVNTIGFPMCHPCLLFLGQQPEKQPAEGAGKDLLQYLHYPQATTQKLLHKPPANSLPKALGAAVYLSPGLETLEPLEGLVNQ